MQERMQTRTKERLGVTDEEWKVLQPKIQKVQTLRRQSGGGGGFRGMAGRRGGRGGEARPAARQLSDVQKKAQELRTLLAKEDAKAGQIKEKLAALRKAREKAKKDLAAARKELREVVTVRQEAQLVLMGLLE
jgi:flagellar motor protein MotB